MRRTVQRRFRACGAGALALAMAMSWTMRAPEPEEAPFPAAPIEASLASAFLSEGVRFPPDLPSTAPDGSTDAAKPEPCAKPHDSSASVRSPLAPVANAATRSTNRSEPVAGDRERSRSLALHAVQALNLAFERGEQRDARCHESAECIGAAYQAGRRAALPSLEALARLATSSRDPQVYASAIYTCVLADAMVLSQACASLSPEQWASLDPDNALPWLYVASAAYVRGDEATLVDALGHADRSRRVVASQMPLFQALSVASPGSEPVRAVMLERQLGAYGMHALPDYASAAAFCDVAAVAEPRRRRVCSALADVLIETGTTLRDMLVGIAIGDKVGWPAQRLTVLRLDSARLLSADDGASGRGARGCAEGSRG